MNAIFCWQSSVSGDDSCWGKRQPLGMWLQTTSATIGSVVENGDWAISVVVLSLCFLIFCSTCGVLFHRSIACVGWLFGAYAFPCAVPHFFISGR